MKNVAILLLTLFVSFSSAMSQVDKEYYENSYVQFGDTVDSEGFIVNEGTFFKLINGERKLYLKIEQDTPLKLSQLIVDVYTGKDYSEFVNTYYFDIPGVDWTYTYFPITFNKAGKYAVDFYNQDDVFINSGYVTIQYR